MAEQDIDGLSIEVSASANAAVTTLQNLANRLGTLERRLGTTTPKLASFKSNIDELKGSVEGLDVSPLESLSQIKFSATVPKNLASLVSTVQQMPADAVTRLQGISTALAGIDGVKLSKSTVDNLGRIPQVMREFESFDTSAFVDQMSQLNPQVAELAKNVTALATAYKGLPKSMQTAGLAARSVASSNKYLQQSNTQLALSAGKLEVNIQSLGAALRKTFSFAGVAGLWAGFKKLFEATVGQVNTYIEDMNLFNASMGEFAQSASEYAQVVQDALGIDMGEWSKYQGVFMVLGESFGIAGDRMAVMSQNLTQLGYDLASFHNMSVDQMMLKIQSGLAGEIEPMRRIGVDLSNAAMQVEATRLGLSKQVSDMNQAEKAALRYRLMLQGTTVAQGDMARTIASPANQLRVLQAQFQMTARAIGNLFIPALNKILPAVIGVVKAIRLLAQTIASLLHIDINFEVDYSSLSPSVDTSGIGDVEDALDDAGKAADAAKKKAREYQNTIMGFDEIHKLNSTPDNSSSASSGAGIGDSLGGGSVLGDIPLDTYDFLAGLTDEISRTTDEIANHILSLLPHIAAVAAGLAAWSVARNLGADIQTAFGWALLLAGTVEYVYNFLDAWVNGVDYESLQGMLLGVSGIIGGLYLVFGRTGAAIGSVVTGLSMMVLGLRDVVREGANLENVRLTVYGLAVMAAGLYALFGPMAAAVGLLAGGIAMVAVGFYDAYKNGMTWQNVELVMWGLVAAASGLLVIFGPLGAAVGLLAGGIALLVTGINDFINNGKTEGNVRAISSAFLLIGGAIALLTGSWIPLLIGALASVVSYIALNWHDIFNSLPQWAQGAINGIIGFFQGLPGFFSGIVNTVKGFFSGLFRSDMPQMSNSAWGSIKSVWQGAGTWFSGIWSTVSGKASTTWSTIKTGASTVWTSVKSTFSGFGTYIGGQISTAWSTIKRAFSSGGQIFNGISSGFQSGFKSVVNSLISGINTVVGTPIRAVNSVISGLKTFKVLGVKPFSYLRTFSVPYIPRLAEGRFGIDAGQLFVAREAGAEMVGSMGGHTTVANNEQIVEGIRSGVRAAVIEALAVSGGGRSEGTQRIEIPLYLENEELARGVWQGELSLVRRGVLKPQMA